MLSRPSSLVEPPPRFCISARCSRVCRGRPTVAVCSVWRCSSWSMTSTGRLSERPSLISTKPVPGRTRMLVCRPGSAFLVRPPLLDELGLVDVAERGIAAADGRGFFVAKLLRDGDRRGYDGWAAAPAAPNRRSKPRTPDRLRPETAPSMSSTADPQRELTSVWSAARKPSFSRSRMSTSRLLRKRSTKAAWASWLARQPAACAPMSPVRQTCCQSPHPPAGTACSRPAGRWRRGPGRGWS